MVEKIDRVEFPHERIVSSSCNFFQQFFLTLRGCCRASNAERTSRVENRNMRHLIDTAALTEGMILNSIARMKLY